MATVGRHRSTRLHGDDGLAGFCAYVSMYAFRKPFTAATFQAVPGWHFALDYKIALMIAQAAGYARSKLIGVKVIRAFSCSSWPM